MTSETAIAAALAAINLLTFISFGLDKRQALTGQRRTRESSLLLMACLGGTPGAYLGRNVFRHKTRKQPFSNMLHTIAFVQVVAVGASIGWQLAP